MCNRLCEVQEPLEAAIAVLYNPVIPLNAKEWVALREVSTVLKRPQLVVCE